MSHKPTVIWRIIVLIFKQNKWPKLEKFWYESFPESTNYWAPLYMLYLSLTCAASWAKELRYICMVFTIRRVHTAGSLMTANSGCRRQPSTDPRTALSMAMLRSTIAHIGEAHARYKRSCYIAPLNHMH